MPKKLVSCDFDGTYFSCGITDNPSNSNTIRLSLESSKHFSELICQQAEIEINQALAHSESIKKQKEIELKLNAEKLEKDRLEKIKAEQDRIAKLEAEKLKMQQQAEADAKAREERRLADLVEFERKERERLGLIDPQPPATNPQPGGAPQ